jgi:hypothetical protein
MPTLLRYYYEDKIKEDKTGGVCGTHLREEKRIQGFGGNV